MVKKFHHKGLFVLSYEPFINSDVVILVHLSCNNFFFEFVGSSWPLDIAAKMPETMNFDYNVSKLAPFRY